MKTAKEIEDEFDKLTPAKKREGQAVAVLKFGRSLGFKSTLKNRLRRKNKKVKGR